MSFEHEFHISGSLKDLHTKAQAKNDAGIPLFDENNEPVMAECIKVEKDGKVCANGVGLVMIRRFLANNPKAVCVPWTDKPKKAK